ncbi:hypothetical protein PIB30_100698, partial [Stylosanthes scabra]|nr:hypothetical protein [Stylosanthes scabra]
MLGEGGLVWVTLKRGLWRGVGLRCGEFVLLALRLCFRHLGAEAIMLGIDEVGLGGATLRLLTSKFLEEFRLSTGKCTGSYQVIK